MVNFKKISAAFLAAAMLFSFSACSKGGDASADNTAETETVAEPSASARVSVDGTKFMVDGKELWINGTNTPWEKWNDFDGRQCKLHKNMDKLLRREHYPAHHKGRSQEHHRGSLDRP